jgi:predicted flap endonuclease-1-like 5' DNA nuclease
MSLRPDQKALVFLGAVAVLGAGVRVSRAASRGDASPTEQAALDRQMASADSAATAGRATGGAKRSGGRGGRRAVRPREWSSDSAFSPPDTGQGKPARRKAGEARTGPGYVNGKLDLDVATAAQIDSLPGVTPTMAKRIAADRMKRGPFLNLDGLRRVSGVGPSLAKWLDTLVTFSGAYTQGAAQDSTIRARPRKSRRGGGAMRPAAQRTRGPPPAPSRL